MTKKVQVYVNGRAILLEESYPVEYAVLRYSQQAFHDIQKGLAYIADAKGDPIGEGGAIFDGLEIQVLPVKR
ncbi:MAG: hypothetical protein ACM3TT_13615 [Syntrophothermus sp.]